MKIHIKNFPPDIIAHYKLSEKGTADGYIYVKKNGRTRASSGACI